MLFSSCHKSPSSSSSSCNKDIFILYLSRNWKRNANKDYRWRYGLCSMPLVSEARTTHLQNGIWERSVKVFHIFWSSRVLIVDKILRVN